MTKILKDGDRREVKEKVETWDKYKFDGDLDQIIEDLKTFREAHKKYHRIEVEEETEQGYYNDSWTNFEVTGVRWETDAEMEKRIKKAKADRKKAREQKAKEAVEKEALERAELERLKKKYE